MNKLAVAGIALVLGGAAAFAGVRIGVYGVCPLTGRPIHCAKMKSFCPPTAECPAGDPRCTEDAEAAAQETAPAAQSEPGRRHCCDVEKGECRPKVQAETPRETGSNP